MIFSSSIFIFIFLPIVLLIYYLIDIKFKNSFLLISSLLFYAYGEPKFVIIMVVSILLNYLIGILISMYSKKLLLKKFALFIGLFCNIALIFYFKYIDFFIINFNSIFNSNFDLLNVLLPIGISFFTFQGMSYLIDLYWDKYYVQKNIINLALYISLFPQLIAGPIVRYKDVNDQIVNREHKIDKFADGIRRFVIGLAKKIIIANAFAVIADYAFNNMINDSLLAWMGIISYAIQIYFDFSGYSDMAIGLGKMFGFDFLENFNYPYIATSVTDFWRRWHISLSSWFRDYIYIPLGGNRKGNVYLNLTIVFLVTGLWHGASWTFIIWGLWHGLFLIIEKLLKNLKIKFPKIIKWFYTIMIVLLGWILFRSVDINNAINYIKIMFSFNSDTLNISTLIFLRENIILFIIAIISAIPLYKFFRIKFKKYELYCFFENIIIIFLFVICITYIITSQYNPFIYFNF